jgi:hypothetical protein
MPLIVNHQNLGGLVVVAAIEGHVATCDIRLWKVLATDKWRESGCIFDSVRSLENSGLKLAEGGEGAWGYLILASRMPKQVGDDELCAYGETQ